MLNKIAAVCASVSLLLGAACLTGDDAVLFVAVDPAVPDTTSDLQVGLTGEVWRTPQQESAILVVTVTGGAITVIDTATLHGLFSVTVPLTTNAANYLSLTAHDNTGATTTGPWQRTVVQVEAPLLRTSRK